MTPPHLAAAKSEWSHLCEALEPFPAQAVLDMCPLLLLLFSHFCFFQPWTSMPRRGAIGTRVGGGAEGGGIWRLGVGKDCERPQGASNGCEWGQGSLEGSSAEMPWI